MEFRRNIEVDNPKFTNTIKYGKFYIERGKLMKNKDYGNVYKAYNSFSKAATFAQSALSNIFKLSNTPTYYSIIKVILLKASKIDLTNFKIKGIATNAFLIYEILKQVEKVINTFYEKQQLTSKILDDSQNTIKKICETTGYLLAEVSDTASIIEPLSTNFEETPLFDLPILDSTNITDDYKLSGQLGFNLIEA